MCKWLDVTTAGYYAWRSRWASNHRIKDAELSGRIREIFEDSRGTYGSPRVHALLHRDGFKVGRRRVIRLMQQAGLKARAARIYRRMPGTKAFFAQVPNRLPASTTTRDQVWVADITYLKLPGRWRYLAAIMDKHSRRIVGWSLGKQRSVQLTVAALNRAVINRQPPAGLIFHTDRGTEYGGYAFRDRAAALGITQSMNRPKEMNDNAHMESFFHSLKSEHLHGQAYTTEDQLASAVRSYITHYNTTRAHSALGYWSPIDFERRAA